MARRLLIVDDMAINRQMLREILCGDYEIVEASSGAEARSILTREYKIIAAVLLDIVMPEMDGYAVLRGMRASSVLAQIPVIMITASGDEDARVKALACGANDFVTKPYNPDIIKHCLRNNINLRETAALINSMQRDKLTGLYNRETFFSKVAARIKDAQPGFFTLSCFDVDNFKLINDQYGAMTGDNILKRIGRVIRDVMDNIGGVGCRISGDNFAALYPAERLNVDVLSLLSAELPGFDLTFRIGRYSVTDTLLEPAAIYDRAYIAKQSVKGLYDKHIAVFDETMFKNLLREREITADMDRALAGRQFEVWYQPQYNHSTGALVGAEALVRWRHPERGLVPPGHFIPVFEQNGFIYELDKYVWEEVCKNLSRWRNEGKTALPVSVNISRNDVFKPDLVEFISGLLEKYALPPDLLRLEITESAFAKSASHIIAVVKQFIALGFTVEIDDFGSGYSSLNTLKDVPAQILKLDMRFLEGNDNTQRGGNIIESIIRMAKWLGMSVIAEGVELIEQADYLKSIGCSYIQGYLYAKPMPLESYEALGLTSCQEERLLVLETADDLDNNAFWDPQSMETLIFNSYVGGACIFEFTNGGIELLRANDRYAQVIGSAGMTVDDALRLDWTNHLDEENKARVITDIKKSIEQRSEVISEYVFLDLPGCPHKTYLRSTLRVIARAGERYLVYCVNENITAQRLTEQALQATDEQLRLINGIAHDLLSHEDAGDGLTAALLRLLQFFNGNRAYIFEFDYGSSVSANTYEVCAPGVSREKDNLQSVPFTAMREWFAAFERRRPVIIEDVSALGDSRAFERQCLSAQGIRSLYAAPLYRNGALIGLLGVDDPQRRLSSMSGLSALGDYIAVMLTRRNRKTA